MHLCSSPYIFLAVRTCDDECLVIASLPPVARSSRAVHLMPGPEVLTSCSIFSVVLWYFVPNRCRFVFARAYAEVRFVLETNLMKRFVSSDGFKAAARLAGTDGGGHTTPDGGTL